MGGVNGRDLISRVHIKNLLLRNGIESMEIGFRILGLRVRASDSKRAERLLDLDAIARGRARGPTEADRTEFERAAERYMSTSGQSLEAVTALVESGLLEGRLVPPLMLRSPIIADTPVPRALSDLRAIEPGVALCVEGVLTENKLLDGQLDWIRLDPQSFLGTPTSWSQGYELGFAAHDASGSIVWHGQLLALDSQWQVQPWTQTRVDDRAAASKTAAR